MPPSENLKSETPECKRYSPNLMEPLESNNSAPECLAFISCQDRMKNVLSQLAWPNLCSASYISSIAMLYICACIYTCKTYVHVPGYERLCGWAVCTCGSQRCTTGVFLYLSTLETVLSLTLKSSLTCLLLANNFQEASYLHPSILDWMYGPALVFYMSARDPQHLFQG